MSSASSTHALIKTCATQTKRTHALSELRLKCAEAEIVAILLRPAKILSSCSDKIYTSKNALKSFYNAWISAAQEARTASELRYSTLARITTPHIRKQSKQGLFQARARRCSPASHNLISSVICNGDCATNSVRRNAFVSERSGRKFGSRDA